MKCGEVLFFTRTFVPTQFLDEWQLKNAVDKVYFVFIKQIFGLNSKASNWAVRSETNRSYQSFKSS